MKAQLNINLYGKSLSLVICIFLLLFMASTVKAQNNANSANLLCDPGFELSPISYFGFFPCSGCYESAVWGDANAILDGAATHIRNGTKSMHIYTGYSNLYNISQPNHTAVLATPGATYIASAWFLFPPEYQYVWVTGNKVILRIQFLDQSGNIISSYDSPDLVKPLTWTQLSVTAVAPANTVSIKYVYRLDKPAASGITVINVDDCSLTQADPPASLEVKPKSCSFGAYNDTLYLKVSNTGGGTLNFSFIPTMDIDCTP